MRSTFALPSQIILKKYFGGLGSVGTKEDCKSVMVAHFASSVNPVPCSIVFDEMYVKPSIRFSGNHKIGYAEDNPQEKARTILTFMVKPLLGGNSFVVRLIPVHSLSPDFLTQQLLEVLQCVVESNGIPVNTVCDNHPTNRSAYRRLATDVNRPWIGSFIHNDCPQMIILLFDSVHLLKSIRNNWVTETNQRISMRLPGEESYVVGKWSDIVSVYKKEKENIVRRTRLSYESCYPDNIQKQKMSLALQVIDEKVVAALYQDGLCDTARVVEFILKFWKIVNTKSTHLQWRLHDSDRKPISSVQDIQINFLEDFKLAISAMQISKGKSRSSTLTPETRSALLQTISGFIDVSQHFSHFSANSRT